MWLSFLRVLAAALVFAAASLHAQPVLDLTGWQPEEGPRALDGRWEFAAGRLLGPADPWPRDAQLVDVPHEWGGDARPRRGAGTYRATVRCDNTQPLALALTFQHSAARVFVNGKLVAEQGQPGLTRDAAAPSVKQQILTLPPAPCPMQVLVQVSNWDMYRGGFVRSVVLGTPAQLAQRHEDIVLRVQSAQGALMFAAVFGLVFWMRRRRDSGPLLFSLFAVSIAVTLSLGGERAHGSIAEYVSFDAFMRIIYVNWFFSLGTFPWVLDKLYPQEGSRRFVWAVSAIAIAGGLLSVATPAHVLTMSTPVLGVASVGVGLYVAVLLARALLKGRQGSAVLLVALAIFSAAVLNDVLLFQRLSPTALMPYGILAFVLAPAVLMAQRFAQALHAQELRTLEQRVRGDMLVRATKAGLLDWDGTTNVAAYSDRFKEMLGYAADADPPPLRELFHPVERERVDTSFLSQLRDRSTRGGLRMAQAIDFRLRRLDGDYMWVHGEGISICDDTGRTLRFIGSFIDISERKRFEEELAQQVAIAQQARQALSVEQERLRLLVRATKAGFSEWNADRDVVTYSDRFLEMLGYPPETDTREWPPIFEMMHPADRERAREEFRTMIRRKPVAGVQEPGLPMSYRLRRADGRYIWIHADGIARVDETGRTRYFITSFLDVTRFHEQEQQLRSSLEKIAEQAKLLESQNETLKDNVRLREEVDRIGRHDIKTPLNSIVAVPRLLREERKLGPEADELLGIVERAGYRILSMVNLSLDLYKMEQGTYVFRPDAVDLIDLVGKVVADVRTHAESKRVQVRQVVRHIPYAWAEELLCYSLVANLLKNAVEASPEGAEVWVRPEFTDGNVLLRIHNQGAVPAAIRDTFFQKYSSLGKASGTGLGTYSARLMARVQDGDVAMATSDATGTTVTVRLPAAPEGALPATTRHVAERRGVEPALISALPPTRVLLVDDDEYNLLIVRRFLPSPPFTVETAINGRVALAMMQSNWPDLVFMDLDMPVMGGMQAVRAMRALERASGESTPCRIVALSSHDDEETRQAAIAAGFDRYLTKPVTRDTVQEMLLLLAPAGTASAPPAPIATVRARASQPVAASPEDPVVVDADTQPMLAQFMSSRHQLIAAMAQAMRSGDRAEVRRIAHQLAGSFGLYGFAWASQQARSIENQAAQIDAERLYALARDLKAHLETAQLRSPLGAIIETTGPGARGGTS
jgi:PAS domain S-box-containing protein